MKTIPKRTSIYLLILILCTATSAAAASFTAQVPCYIKISAGGELRVSIDIDRKADLDIRNAAGDESVFTVMEYRNGKPREGSKAEASTLNKNENHKNWKFNRYFKQTPPSSQVDEVRVTVKKGAVYAELGQTGDDRKDFYNNGYQRGTFVDPKRPLTIHITGDNPVGGQTSGSFWLEYEGGNYSEKTPFTVETGKTLTWNYPADQKIVGFEVNISKGQAKISLDHLSSSRKAAPKQPAIETAPQPKHTGKATPPPKKSGDVAATSDAGEKTASSGTILNGEVPCMEGGKVLKEMATGANSRVDLEVPANPEEVVNFYKQAMTAKGWQPGMTMVQGPVGILQLSKGKSQIMIKAQGQGQKSIVTMAVTTR